MRSRNKSTRPREHTHTRLVDSEYRTYALTGFIAIAHVPCGHGHKDGDDLHTQSPPTMPPPHSILNWPFQHRRTQKTTAAAASPHRVPPKEDALHICSECMLPLLPLLLLLRCSQEIGFRALERTDGRVCANRLEMVNSFGCSWERGYASRSTSVRGGRGEHACRRRRCKGNDFCGAVTRYTLCTDQKYTVWGTGHGAVGGCSMTAPSSD